MEEKITFPLVSVCIPCYNAAQHLDECVESVLRQTYPNVEVVLFDDKSRDGTVEILRDWERAFVDGGKTLSLRRGAGEPLDDHRTSSPEKSTSERTDESPPRVEEDASNGGGNRNGHGGTTTGTTAGDEHQQHEDVLHEDHPEAEQLLQTARRTGAVRRRLDWLLQQQRFHHFVEGFRIVIGVDSPRNRGEGYARNEAIKLSRGDYLCTMDADDIMHDERVEKQMDAMLRGVGGLDLSRSIIGCGFTRLPEDSTHRYTKWANEAMRSPTDLWLDQYREVTIIHPTWLMARETFHAAGGYTEHRNGQEDDAESDWRSPLAADQRFMMRHIEKGLERLRLTDSCSQKGGELQEIKNEDVEFDVALQRAPLLYKVNEPLLIYRHIPGATLSANTPAEVLFQVRIEAFQKRVLEKWCSTSTSSRGGEDTDTTDRKFTIWGAGRDGKLFFKLLGERFKGKVRAFCDIDEKKQKIRVAERGGEEVLKPKMYVHAAFPQFKIPVVSLADSEPPYVICVAKGRYGDEVYAEIAKLGGRGKRRLFGGGDRDLVEGKDYWFFC